MQILHLLSMCIFTFTLKFLSSHISRVKWKLQKDISQIYQGYTLNTQQPCPGTSTVGLTLLPTEKEPNSPNTLSDLTKRAGGSPGTDPSWLCTRPRCPYTSMQDTLTQSFSLTERSKVNLNLPTQAEVGEAGKYLLQSLTGFIHWRPASSLTFGLPKNALASPLPIYFAPDTPICKNKKYKLPSADDSRASIIIT